MKRSVMAILLVAFVLNCGQLSVSGGDIPESVLRDDDASLFFGEVITYDESAEQIVIMPKKIIKGIVDTNTPITFSNFVICTQRVVAPGERYLIAACNNSEMYLLSTTSEDPSTLTIEGIHQEQGMWARMQKLLNDGDYTKKQTEILLELYKKEEAEAANERAAVIAGGFCPYRQFNAHVVMYVVNRLHNQNLRWGVMHDFKGKL